MYTPKLTTKRALGLGLAAALALTGTVALASNSQAAVATVRLSPANGSPAGGSVVTISGTGFLDTFGVSTVGTVWFETTACAIADIAVNPVISPAVISSTKVVIGTPALALTSSPTPTVYNLCISNAANTAVTGTAKLTSYAVPTINDQTLATIGVTPVKGVAAGGGTVTIKGENFTKKTTATIGGVPLTKVKVTIGALTVGGATGGDDVLTGTVPAGTGAAKPVFVISEGGKSTVAAGTFSYANTVVVSPKTGNGTQGNGLTLTGSGFSALTFSATLGTSSQVVLVQAIPTSPASLNYCGNVHVENDKVLTCTLTAPLNDGPYTAMVITDASSTTIASTTAISNSATYTVSDF